MSAYRETTVWPVIVVAFGDRVFGVDPATGEARWEHETESTGAELFLLVTPTEIFVAARRGLTCLRYPTGEVVWSAESRAYGRPSMVLEGDRLLVGRGGEVECYTRSGQFLWHNPFKGKGAGPVALATPSSAAQADQSG